MAELGETATMKRKIVKVEIPMAVDCIHPSEDPEEGPEFISMDIEVDDPEIPTYTAKCPKCGCKVLIDFNP